MPRYVLAVVLSLVCAVACSREPASSRPVVGVSLLTQTHAFFKDLEDGLRQEAQARGLELVIVACEMDPAKQASQIEDFVAQRVAAILLAPCDSDAVGPHLAGPERAGIPVFTADIAARGGRVVSHIASDNTQGGRLAAQALAEAIGGAGEVLIIDHPSVASVQDRVAGFVEEMQKHPGIRIVARPSSDGQRARAMAVMEDMLQVYPKLKGVFGINDDSALGATAVLNAAGRTDIAVIGYDASEEARAAIVSGGPLRADVVQNPALIGRTAIEMIARHLQGEEVPEIVPIEVGLWRKGS
ncbi:MAG: substrate-binding domain-containing protein [Vicinamibacterales bacterium]